METVIYQEEFSQGPVVGAKVPEWAKIYVISSRWTFVKIKLSMRIITEN